MFLKKIIKTDKTTRKQYAYYRLVESYRIGNQPRHRTILNLGRLDGLDDRQRKTLADRIEELIKSSGGLFGAADATIEPIAQKAYKRIIDEQLLDLVPVQPTTAGKADYQNIDLNSVEHEDAWQAGAEWMSLQMIERMGVAACLATCGLKEKFIKVVLSNWIARMVYPTSELETARWLQQNSACCQLIETDPGAINHTKLYKAARQLYKNKEALEKHLCHKTDQLFGSQDKILLYDLTNTYFEGRMQQASKAQHGRSKEKRTDAPLITLALVTDQNGFVKYSHFYKGNIGEPTTLQNLIATLESQTNTNPASGKPLIVIDAGIATEENLTCLRKAGYDYLCVSRSRLKDFEAQIGEPVLLKDKNDQPIEVKIIKPENKPDTWLYVNSYQKRLKEQSIDNKLSGRFLVALEEIKAALSKKGGTKKINKVHERIGRIKQKYPLVSGLFTIEITEDKTRQMATDIKWKQHQRPPEKQNGVYFIRTTFKEQSEKQLWNIYNTLREIEATFRVLKTDLSIRPVYHRKDETIEAHLFLGILAYHIVSVIRHQLKAAGIKHCWKEIVRIMNTQKLVTTTMMTKKGDKIYLRKPTRPNPEVQQIYQILKLNKIKKQKSVVPQN